MPTLYDADGNPVELPLSPEEVKVLQAEKAKQDADLAEAKERLTKLENKDFNFKRLKNMTEEEMKKLSTQELELMKRQEKLEEETQNFTKKIQDSAKAEALARFAGDDEELRKKAMYHYERIKDEAQSPEEIRAKMHDAVTLARGRAPEPNPIYSAINYNAGDPPKKKEEASQAVKDLGKKLGLKDEELKNLK